MSLTGSPAGATGPDDQARLSPDLRLDPFVDAAVYVVGSRQSRPNLPSQPATAECPFCPGGLEAPQDHDTPWRTHWFVNRWPAFANDRCEVVLYSPDHTATWASLGADGLRQVIDLWTERTRCLGARDDVAYVLIFENRGAEVGATISHPHGQIYAYDHVPPRPAAMFSRHWEPTPATNRAVTENSTWMAYVPHASTFPIALSITPKIRLGSLTDLDSDQKTDLSQILVEVNSRLERLYGLSVPYMMWINQRPTDGSQLNAWMNIDLVSPWRAAGLARFIAAAEIGGGEFFNPVIPEELAAVLRDL